MSLTEAHAQAIVVALLEASGIFAAGSVGLNNRSELLDQMGAAQKAPYAVVETADQYSIRIETNSVRHKAVYTVPLILIDCYDGTEPLTRFTALRDSVNAALAGCGSGSNRIMQIAPLTDIVPFERLQGTDRHESEFYGQAIGLTMQGF